MTSFVERIHAEPLSSERFETRRVLGEGSYGIVYEAFDRERSTLVAVKALTRFAPDALSRFKLEFRALADLSHPNLVQLHELIEHQGTFVIVMELVQGVDFSEFVRPLDTLRADNLNAPLYRETRLREALIQLADGLEVLHRADLVHRDLKPSNMRITKEGRLVLLDFGMVAELSGSKESDDGAIAGSAGYMAPEQAKGRVGPPADWYAVGSVLFEALTGHLPFDGVGMEILLKKQHERPPPPSMFVKGIPEDLDRLCLDLLDPNPNRRPTASEVRERLAATALPTTIQPLTAGSPFAGRQKELEALEGAVTRVREGTSTRVVIEGESGVGKTALVQEFLLRLEERASDALVLRGRCFELEAVPFKGIDGVVDALSRYVMRLSREECEALLPRRAALLPKLFPVLGVLPNSGSEPRRNTSRDPSVQRREAIHALLEFFERIAEHRLLVIVIDDLQWADVETFRLLEELEHRDEGPAILWLMTCRPREEVEAERDWLTKVYSAPRTQVLSLHGLPDEEAQTLATDLLGDKASKGWARAVAEKSQGHPLLIGELSRFVTSGAALSADGLSLEAALNARLSALEKGTRELLELVMLAGRPRPVSVFAAATGRAPEALTSAVATLRAGRLVSTGQSGRLRSFHDRIRRAISALIPPDTARKRHAQLALALETQPDGDFHAAVHWQEAGALDRALPLFERAARTAIDTLAFERAAALFERMLAIFDPQTDPSFVQSLKVKRAHALAEAGRSSEAARAFLEAAESAGAEDGLELRCRAAQHLLQAAEVKQGIEVLTELSTQLKLGLPTGPKAAFLKLIWHRMVLSFRGLQSTPKDASEIAPDVLKRLDLIHSISPGLTWIDIFRGAELGARHLRLALGSGEREHSVIALSAEALAMAIQGDDVPERCWELIERARKLARDVRAPAPRAFIHMAHGQMLQCQWRTQEALVEFERAEQTYAEQVKVDWHQSVGRTFMLGMLGLAGEYRKHGLYLERFQNEARARDDRFAQSNYVLMGLGGYRHLLRDRPDKALSEMEAACALWPDDHAGMPQFGAFYSHGAVMSYQSWETAYCRSHEDLKRLLRTALAYPRFVRAGLFQVHALNCIGFASQQKGESRKALVAQCRDYASRIARVHVPTRNMLSLTEGQAFLLDGKRDEAHVQLTKALAHFEKLGSPQWERQVRVGLAACEGKTALQRAIEGEAAFLSEQGFVNVERALRWLYPVAHAAL